MIFIQNFFKLLRIRNIFLKVKNTGKVYVYIYILIYYKILFCDTYKKTCYESKLTQSAYS